MYQHLFCHTFPHFMYFNSSCIQVRIKAYNDATRARITTLPVQCFADVFSIPWPPTVSATFSMSLLASLFVADVVPRYSATAPFLIMLFASMLLSQPMPRSRCDCKRSSFSMF